jgi:hypothetical protein
MLINSPNISGSLKVSGNTVITGSLTTSIAALGSPATIFLTSDGGTIKSRTAAQTLSDLGAQATGSYVPYTGATLNVDLGTRALTAGALTAGGLFVESGPSFGGALNLRQATGFSLWNGAPYTSIYATTGNRVVFNFSNDNRTFTLDGSLVSAATPRTFTFPDATGTFALTSQIPTVAGAYLPLTGGAITGSLIVTGGITGNVTGSASTASYVEYSNVANKPTLVSGSGQISFTGITNKPTLVSGSSQITYSGLSGIPNGIVSGSAQVGEYGIFATTGSNTFVGSQTITGSIFGTGNLTINGCITATGQIVAQTINVQQVTSSIVYSCGSNIFGTSVSNTQQFTGSMLATGSLTLAGPMVGSSTACFGGNVTTSGCVGIGTPTAATPLHIVTAGLPTIRLTLGSEARCHNINGVNLGRDLQVLPFRHFSVQTGNGIAEGQIVLNAYEDFIVGTGASYTSRLTITPTGIACFACQVCAPVAIFTGCVGIGTTSPCYKLDVRNASGVGAQTIVSVVNKTNDSNTGAFIGFGDAYTDTVSPYLFAARVGGTREGSGDGGFMSFYTRPTSGFEYERMRITAGGIACFACQVCLATRLTVQGGGNSIYAWSDCLDSQPGMFAVSCIGSAISGLYAKVYGPTVNAGIFGINTQCAAFIGTEGACNKGLIIGTINSAPIYIGTGNSNRVVISDTGIACFACQVCAPSVLFNTAGTSGLFNTNITSIADFNASSRSGFTGLVNNCNGVYFGMGAENSGISAGIGFFRESVGWNSALAFYTNCVTDGVTVPRIQEKMRITSGGNVGIRTASPRATLHVQQSTNDGTPVIGTARDGAVFTANNGNYGLNITVDPVGMTHLQSMRFDGQSVGYNLILQPSACNVGIGNSSPSYKLHVSSTTPFGYSGGGATKQHLINSKTAASSGTALKLFYVGFSHAVRLYLYIIQDSNNIATATADFTTTYGASNGGITQSSRIGNISSISANYNNGGSPAYTIDVTVAYTGTAPTIYAAIEGISNDAMYKVD